nr:LysR family transcriptional regulator [Azospirillum sp. SYSU D00513]
MEFDWNDLRYLLAVIRTGSFRGAGGVLGKDQATVSRRIVTLEKDLGRPLLERSSGPGANVRILDEAADLLDILVQIETQTQKVQAWASDADNANPVRIRANDLLISTLLTPIVNSHRMGPFKRSIDRIARIDLSDVELLSEESGEKDDILLQLVPSASVPKGADELVRKLASIRFVPLMTDQYAARHGEPRKFEDLADYRLATLTIYERLDLPTAMGPWNQLARVNKTKLFRSPSVSSIERVVAAGEAIALLPSYMPSFLETLRPVKCASPVMAADLWGVSTKEAQARSKVRAVYEAISDALRLADWGSSPTPTSGR